MAAAGILHDQSLEKAIEKQMGCMAGFLQIFDRHQVLTGKRTYSGNHLSSSQKGESLSESECSVASPSHSKASEREAGDGTVSSQNQLKQSQVTEGECCSSSEEVIVRPPRPFPVFNAAKSSWKFKEAPRLSLDSRATFDAKGSLCPKQISTNSSMSEHRRSPSVIARLMGLEHFPNDDTPPPQKEESKLQRSSSESRVSRVSLPFEASGRYEPAKSINASTREESPAFPIPRRRSETPTWQSPKHQKCSFDSNDFFPGQPRTGSTGEIEVLKEILHALHLKGLLHHANRSSRKTTNDVPPSVKSPIVVMKPLSTNVIKTASDSASVSFRVRAGGHHEEDYRDRTSAAIMASSRNVLLPKRRNPETLQRLKMRADVKEGKNLLDRCDKLLHSIAEITPTTDAQPSPVSVLDSFPSPVTKGSEGDELDGDCDYAYVAEMLHARRFLPADSNVFLLIENRKFAEASQGSKVRRKLVFDAVSDILNKKREVPPWKEAAWRRDGGLPEVWTEFKRVRDVAKSGDPSEDVSRAVRKDVVSGEPGHCVEVAELVLDIERQIFKDLITDGVLHLASNHVDFARRRLVF